MKTRKLFKTLSLIFASILTLGLTSCGHTHTLEHIVAKDPTCTESGNIEYWHCTDCDKYYEDEECKNEIEKSSLTLAALGHSLTHIEKAKPTCTEDGNIEYWHCDRCNLNFGDEKGSTKLDSVVVKATGHNLSHTVAKEPTCTEKGNIEYWTCLNCAKFFSDSEAKTEITYESIFIAPLGHKPIHHEAKAPTCTEAGNIEYWSCDRCKKNFSDEACTTEVKSVVIEAAGHKAAKVEGKPATCTEKGIKEHWHCSVCNKDFSDEACEHELETVEIPALGHKVTKVTGKPATCTEDGVKEHWHCSTCNKNFEDEACKKEMKDVVIKATGHKATKVEGKAPTCTEKGIVEHYHCSVCNKNFEDEACTKVLATVEIPALGHKTTHHEAKAATCTEDGNIEYWSCERCKKNFKDEACTEEVANVVIKATGHSVTKVEGKPATCTEKGVVEHYHCSVCNKNFEDKACTKVLETVEIPALGHKVIHHEAKAATCTEEGNIEYWSCDRCKKNFSDEACTKEVTDVSIPALGHDYEATYDGYALEYTLVCKRDSSHTETIAAGTSAEYPILVSEFEEFNMLDQFKYGSALLPTEKYAKDSTIYFKFLKDIVIPKTGLKAIEEPGLSPVINLYVNADINMNGKTISFEQFSEEIKSTPAILSILEGADATIHGNGKFDTLMGPNGAYCINVNHIDSVLTIKDGTYLGGPTGIQVQQGKLNVEGGYFWMSDVCAEQAPELAKYEINCIDKSFKDGTATINVTGGTFRNFDPSSKPEAPEGSTYVNKDYMVTEVQKEGYKEYTVSLKVTK